MPSNPAAAPTIHTVSGTGVPIRGDDIDTDQILPARFLKEVTFENMGEYLFYDVRQTGGEPNDHPLNVYDTATIAVVNKNFGCGSSREHAPQAMARWGIDGIVGESFAAIFRDNCASIGLPAVTADAETVAAMQSWVTDNQAGEIEIDVAETVVRYGDQAAAVEMDETTHEAFVTGRWDTTALLAANGEAVAETAAALPYTENDAPG